MHSGRMLCAPAMVERMHSKPAIAIFPKFASMDFQPLRLLLLCQVEHRMASELGRRYCANMLASSLMGFAAINPS